MVLCLDSGPAYDLRWCPLPSHDLVLIILLLRICSCLMFFFFFDSSMMTNDNRRSWDCLAELLKTELLLFNIMLFLIHRTWYLLNMISPILFVVYLILLLSKLLKVTHVCF